jgi:glycosyltransferase involved in cell wall biosynthesis
MTDHELARCTGLTLAPGFTCRFGPLPVLSMFGIQVRSKARFRSWIKRNLRDLAKEGGPCLFYFRTLRLANYLGRILRDRGWPYVFEPHEVFFENARKPEGIRRIEQEVYQDAAYLFPITQALSLAIRSKLGITTPMCVAPLGHSGANLALPLYDPEAPPRFLYVGSLHRWKGLTVAFEATAGLDIPFDVVGDAGGLKFHRDYCAQQGFSHVRFYGQVAPDEVRRFYHPGSICLLPLSDTEIARAYTSPLKLFEYLAAGRPVVAGDVPSMREILTHGVHARLVPVGSVPAWRAALVELLRNRSDGLRLAVQGRALAESSTWTRRAQPIVSKLLALVRARWTSAA